MPPRPTIEPLPQRHRQVVFALTLITFCLAVPALVFYAMGYRYDFTDEVRNIRAVGGMYITSEVDEIFIYVDNEPVEDMRIFQNAAYVQNLDAGLHRVHVQGNNIQTWVKDLPVYSHFVTEANSFNLPQRPQIRLITPYVSSVGESVISPGATSSFAFASTSNNFLATTSTATTTLEANSEYVFVKSLMASTTEERKERAEALAQMEERFRFGVDSLTATSVLGTTTKQFRNVVLYEEGDEVYAKWVGDKNKVPYYYCVTYTGKQATALAYGSHVMEALETELGSTIDLTNPELDNTQLCRTSIRIDRKWQNIEYFDFVPGNEHLVLLQLNDGIYVAEVDDRSWQNVQLLYPGDYLEVVVEGGQIFIQDGENYLEVATELPR